MVTRRRDKQANSPTQIPYPFISRMLRGAKADDVLQGANRLVLGGWCSTPRPIPKALGAALPPEEVTAIFHPLHNRDHRIRAFPRFDCR